MLSEGLGAGPSVQMATAGLTAEDRTPFADAVRDQARGARALWELGGASGLRPAVRDGAGVAALGYRRRRGGPAGAGGALPPLLPPGPTRRRARWLGPGPGPGSRRPGAARGGAVAAAAGECGSSGAARCGRRSVFSFQGTVL